MLRRRALLVLSSVLVCTAGAAFFALREMPQYRATAVLRLGGSGREAITQGFEAPVEEGDRYVNPLLSQTELLRSRSLIADAVDAVGYRLRPDYSRYGPNVVTSVRVAPGVVPDTLWVFFYTDGVIAQFAGLEGRADYGQPLSVGGVGFTVPRPQEPSRTAWTVISQEQAVDRMLAQLRITPRVETNIVDVSFLHPNPETARSVVNTLVMDYQQFEADFAQERSRRRRLFLEEQVAQADSGLAQAQANLRNFQSRGQTYNARQELSAQQQNRMLLDIRRGELDADRSMFGGLLAQLDSSNDEERWEVLRTLVSAPGIAENPAVSRIHEQLIRQRAELDSLTSGSFGSSVSNPDVQRQMELIRTSEGELSGAIRSHLASLDARAAALEELAERTSEALAGLPYQLAEEARLDQIVETYQTVSEQVREELQRTRVAEAATVGQVDVIDLANLPYEPEPGTRAIKIAVGLLAGLTLGFGSAFLLERGNRVVQTRAEVEEAFRVPVMGVIPKALDSDLADLERLLSTNGTPKVEWKVGDQPAARKGSQPREAYRLLRTNLMFASWTDGVRNIVVTSTAPQEGKTLTSASLAASLAEEGVRVLLMDADLWRGRIHDMVGVPQSPGLADVLAGKVEVPSAIRRTGLATLDVLPRGTRQSDPSLLARSTALDHVLSQLDSEYDLLVIDAPPVLAAGSAPVVPAVADGVLLVVRAGQTDRGALRECLRELGTVGASVLGIVLNDPEDLTAWNDRGYHTRYEYAESES
ncbi:MAG: polysaccharide biosynthesis tyrosine autokinase [Gemmatimonadetes bacterium]|nr:polysaccharide biosynthesis tyrosine autokinase [Gemmatimonadota bacterium]